MDQNEKIIKLYLSALMPFALFAIGWAFYTFPFGTVDLRLAVLSVITIFSSSYLRIQLPRTKIHLTISDALVFLSLLVYGGEVAVLLATLESTIASLNFRRQGGRIRYRTMLVNVLIATVSTAATVAALSLFFGSEPWILEDGLHIRFIWLCGAMALSQFLVHSVCVAVFVAIKGKKSVLQIWKEYCLSALMLYFSSAVAAGLSAKALQQINILLFAAVILLFALVYLTYKRYVDDIKTTSAKAEDSERQRAEQAEDHVRELKHYVGELEKTSQALRDSREKFRHAAYHDNLTGLSNRNYFIETLKSMLGKTADGSSSKFAVLFLDLNRFKTINDSLGHSAGDELIKLVALRLKNMAGDNNLVSRFSGDEFAVLLADIRNVDSVTKFANDLAATIAEPFKLHGRRVFVSVSVGIAFDNSKYSAGEEILRDADIAMYYAKEEQKNYAIFDQRMHTRAVSLMELETDLRHAIENDELELYYQPIIRLDTMILSGFEALVRWKHPKRGLISPGEFIPVSEATGLIVPMTIKILYKACRQIVEWQERSLSEAPLTVNVNISGKHFAEGDLVTQVKSVLEDTRIYPPHLKLEITESAVMSNAEHTISVLNQIKASGVRLSIDDFGTGYSSLSYLHRFPIDTLKIDQSFVGQMESGHENGEIVKAVIALASALNLNVVAEGIESISQLHQLQILGCEYGQGYLFSRPRPANEIELLLERPSSWENLAPQPDLITVSEDDILIIPEETGYHDILLVQ